LFTKVLMIYWHIRAYVNIFCVKNADLMYVKTDGMYGYHFASRNYTFNLIGYLSEKII
jgi:hypothetical protein